jgi:hypothetical protein
MSKGTAVAYAATGGIILYSGVRGATITDTLKAVLAGNLKVTQTQPITQTIPASANANVIPGSNTGGTPAKNKALAKQIAASMGLTSWTTGPIWDAWDKLYTRESKWDETAENPSSGAYGIPQALPPTKMPIAAQKPQSDPATQIRWSIGDIQARYGNPLIAWAHEQANGWY